MGLSSSVLLDTSWVSFFDTCHLCSCGSTLDPHEDYMLGCGHGRLCFHWYDAFAYYPIILFQALLQDNSQIKREQYIFVSYDVIPRDTFNPEFADSQPTYIVWYLC